VTRNLTVPFVDANDAVLYRTDRSPVEQETIKGETDVMRAETLDFLDAVENGGATRTPMIEGARTLELVLTANESASSGKIIDLG